MFSETVDLTHHEQSDTALEGTGAMVLDRVNKVAYSCESERANSALAKEWCSIMGFELFEIGSAYNTESGARVHHTDVMMAIGAEVAVVCFDCISDSAKRDALREKLSKTHSIIEITIDQMYKYCGNIFELYSPKLKGPVMIMSETAFNAFTSEQLEVLKQHGIAIGKTPIPIIESFGGGSVRCCIAELY